MNVVGEKRIMIVEDDIGIRGMIKRYLLKNGYSVETAENGEQALKRIHSTPPHLILLDIELPGQDGFEICKEIRKSLTVPIIFLSARRDTLDKVKCFELGGDDYITKPFNFMELKARIKANLRRYETEVPEKLNVLTYGELEINLNNFTCSINDIPINLSAKEMELLIHLAQYPNQVWSHEQLYNRIWKFDCRSDISTVKVHISRLRRKLEKDAAKPKYIKTVRGFGYNFTNPS